MKDDKKTKVESEAKKKFRKNFQDELNSTTKERIEKETPKGDKIESNG